MKAIKMILSVILVFGVSQSLFSQNVSPRYSGFWKNKGEISLFDLLELPSATLPYLRNEVYARYGRIFITPSYQNYFTKQAWYTPKADFQDSWLSAADRANVALILSLERPALNTEEMKEAILKNLEYKDSQGLITITGERQLMWMDPRINMGMYSAHGSYTQKAQWRVWGDWILLYPNSSYMNYDIIAYKLDHKTQRITATQTGIVSQSGFEKLGFTQN